MSVAGLRGFPRAPFARRFDGVTGRRLLWLAVVVMLGFGAAELPALARMSSHGTGVLGFEFAGSTDRMREILTRWGSAGGVAGAREHVFIDLGFILGYGVLLVGACGRLYGSFKDRGRMRTAAIAALLAWGALIAAAVNVLQKLFLWLEIHDHVAQPLPALAAACGAITFTLAMSAALFAVLGTLALRRLPAATELHGGVR